MNNCFVILGMHRSYTSRLAGMFAGQMPVGKKLLPADRGNPLGYYEDREILQLNKEILKAAGGKWDNPPSWQDVEEIKHLYLDRARELANRYEGEWCFKDPRTILTWPVWDEVLDNRIVVSIMRPKEQVVDSLIRRDGMAAHKAEELWHTYNNRLAIIIHRETSN